MGIADLSNIPMFPHSFDQKSFHLANTIVATCLAANTMYEV